MPKKLTTIKASRAKCLDCTECPKDVRECPFKTCGHYLYRFGRRPKTEEVEEIIKEFGASFVRTPVKSHRTECLACMCGQAAEVRKCPSKQCHSWRFRMGKNLDEPNDLKDGDEEKTPS